MDTERRNEQSHDRLPYFWMGRHSWHWEGGCTAHQRAAPWKWPALVALSFPGATSVLSQSAVHWSRFRSLGRIQLCRDVPRPAHPSGPPAGFAYPHGKWCFHHGCRHAEEQPDSVSERVTIAAVNIWEKLNAANARPLAQPEIDAASSTYLELPHWCEQGVLRRHALAIAAFATSGCSVVRASRRSVLRRFDSTSSCRFCTCWWIDHPTCRSCLRTGHDMTHCWPAPFAGDG